MNRISIKQASALVVIAFAFGFSWYRAATQPIAHDEALSFQWFVDGGIYRVLQFNSTNHVLFTILSKLCVWLFGIHELALRLPSLVGTAIYGAACYFLCRRLFGDTVFLPITVGLLTLNPQMLDFMAAARGYILGLAFLLLATYKLLRIVDAGKLNFANRSSIRDGIHASIFLALSVACNLTNLLPAISLFVAFCFSISLFELDRDALVIFCRRIIAPGVMVALGILWPFLIQARPSQFRMGTPQIADSLRDAFSASFLYKWTEDTYSSILGAVAPAAESWQARVTDVGAFALLPTMFVMLLAGIILLRRQTGDSSIRAISRVELFSGATVLCAGLTLALHFIVKMNYPVSRTCLYFIPLSTISFVLILDELSARFPGYRLRAAMFALIVIVLSDYGFSLNVRYFRYNAYDRISRHLYDAIVGDAEYHNLVGARVGGTWWYEPEINFYRRKYKTKRLAPYDVKDASYFWESPNSLRAEKYDYYVFAPANDPHLQSEHPRIIFQDAVTGIKVSAIAHSEP